MMACSVKLAESEARLFGRRRFRVATTKSVDIVGKSIFPRQQRCRPGAPPEVTTETDVRS